MLWLLAKEIRVGIRKNENTVIAVDRPEFSARVTRQPRVPPRMDVARAPPLSRLEPCSQLHVPARRQTLCDQCHRLVRSQRRNRLYEALRMRSTLDPGAPPQPPCHNQLDQPPHPSFLVAHHHVFTPRHLLARLSR